jgi:hypothetical protein
MTITMLRFFAIGSTLTNKKNADTIVSAVKHNAGNGHS